MITSVNYSLFPSAELLTFAKRSAATVEAKQSQLPAVIPFVNNATAKWSVFQSALERESKNPVTKAQTAADGVRNDAFLAFRSFSESAESRHKAGWNNAAGIILAVIRKHGWSAHALGYKAKSAAINNVVTEIRTKYANELALIGGIELLEELDAAQLNFEAVAKQHVEVASANNEPTVAEARPELITALRALLQFVGLQQIAAPSAELTALINELGELVTSSLSTLKASDTRAENKKKEDADNKP